MAQKLMRMFATVAADRMADALEALADVAESVVFKTHNGDPADLPDATSFEAADVVDEEPTPARRASDVRRVVNHTPIKRPVTRARLAGKVLYTPMGTARQIEKMLADLRGVPTMRALVLRDLAKHPGSSNREVRERIATAAKKNGLSVESVDNVIWQLVNKGQITKRADAE